MLDRTWVRDHLDEVETAMKNRGAAVDIEAIRRLDQQRRKALHEVETLKARRNAVSGDIARLKKEGKDATALIEEMRGAGDRIKELDARAGEADEKLETLLLNVPNLPHASVPVGKTAEDNVEVRRWGTPPKLSFAPKAHWDLGEALGILDFERAAKMTGARFTVSMGAGARLERALINFMLDLQTKEHGYTEVMPPLMVNEKAMTGTGNLPKFADDLFKVVKDEGAPYYLIPTAEVPLTNLYREETIEGDRLPLSYTAYTPCFRSEAGSYGKDVKGLIRQHQFNKVELVKFTKPEESMDALERLTKDAETVLQRLGLPYRVIALCTGDMGFASMKTYDIEVWLPSFDTYREISSCSNCGDFQARRAGIRFRRGPSGKTELAHTLNGSGLAVGRTLVAILENGQREDGSIAIPEALVPYFGGSEITAAR
ncbi:MAG TPA: serine--tRNA ligase [Candidatus Polarisedimenticolia bacterium]|jgi:seryl-tRNA synthetase|nr:serine--tRNA ligase [Candidatus Polarisedimenticolia bacterium]